jgi:hypothetical protein
MALKVRNSKNVLESIQGIGRGVLEGKKSQNVFNGNRGNL